MLRDLKVSAIGEDEAIQRLERSPSWVWTAMDPQSKLLLVIDVGTRTLEMAQRVVHQVVARLAPGCVPLCLTDGLKDYGTAFLTHWLLLDSRVVDLTMSYNPIFVMVASLKPLFFNGLKN